MGGLLPAFKRGDFDLVIGSLIKPLVRTFFIPFHSQSIPPKGRNRGRYKSEKMDRLLSNAMSLMAKKEGWRLKRYKSWLMMIISI